MASQTTGKEEHYQVIGTRPIRPDGVDKVTGRAQYGADIHLSGMLYGAVLRSPHAHARIVSIDTAEAETLPGVTAIVTSADLPRGEDVVAPQDASALNLFYNSSNILARGKVLYYGHAIAAVAATSIHIALQAVERIQVTYELLPPVLYADQAMADGAPILLDHLYTDELGQKGDRPSNVASHLQLKRGDLEKGFAEAAVIVEREFRTSTVHQGYIEPHSATALYGADGLLTVWTSTQGAFNERDQIAEILQIPVSRIRVIPLELGGGFGGKNRVYLSPVAALLSQKSGHRPVKLTMSYHDVLSATGPTSGSCIRVKMGADERGRITAAQAYLAYEAGAYPGSFVGLGMNVIFGPYRLDHFLIDGYDVVVNRPRSATLRAPGATQAAFASETVIDELAEKLGIDPLEFRLINCVQEGDRQVDGPKHKRIGCRETIEAARQHAHYSAPLGGPHRGRGVACGYFGNYGGRSSASASINADGTVSLLEGSVDVGGSRASIAMQLAETLGIPVTDVKPLVGDTDTIAYTEGSYGSRTTFATGLAVYELGQKLIQQLIERAARWWDVGPDEVHYERGVFATGTRQLAFKELAAKLDGLGSPVMASATVSPRTWGPAFATHLVDVEVDPETAKVQILRYTAVQDVGTAIHPSYVEGQLQGAVAQGVGWALNEEYVYDEQGRLLNTSLLDYRLPTCLDLPMIDTVIVEVPSPDHPYGVRGVGEVPILPPPAAIANAIYRAIGARLRALPMSPPRILEALGNR